MKFNLEKPIDRPHEFPVRVPNILKPGYWFPPNMLAEARALAHLLSANGSDDGSAFVCWYAQYEKLWVAHYSPDAPNCDASIDECWVDGEVVNAGSSCPADVTAAVKQYLRSQTKEKQKRRLTKRRRGSKLET